MIVVVLLAGLWPFDFFPSNKARLSKNGEGIDFYGRGIAYLYRADEALGAGPASLDIFIEPGKEPSNYIAYIFTSYYNEKEVFSLSQWRTNLILRSRPASGQVPLKEVFISDVLLKNTPVFLRISAGEGAITVKVNGKETVFKGITFKGADAKTIVLGNSITGRNPFKGKIKSLALREASGEEAIYPFEKNNSGRGARLEVSEKFIPLKRVALSSPVHDFHLKRYYFVDLFINIFGFVPFGFMTSLVLFRFISQKAFRVYIAVFLFSFLLSLSIEVSQIWLPGRNSSMTDLISNSIGALLGLLLFEFLKRKDIRYLRL